MAVARRWSVLVAVGLMVLTGAGWALRSTGRTGWTEIAWPFPRDAWPPGLAFACIGPACGGELQVFIRPKRGFCANCDTGVVSDAEVDAVADVDLLAADFTPVAAGGAVTVGSMVGWQRAYTVPLPRGGVVSALGMAMTRPRQCDLVVAVARGASVPQAGPAIDALLTSDRVTRWIGEQLDGR